MAQDNKVEINIILKGAEAAKDLKSFSKDAADGLKEVKNQAKDAAQGLKETSDASGGLGKVLDGLKIAAIATAAALAAYKGLKEVVGFLNDAKKEAAEAEVSLVSLHAILVATGRAAGGFEQNMIDLAKAMQTQAGYSHEVVESAIKILSAFGDITNDLMPRTVKATINLARGWGIDLPSAARMVGMASEGMTRGLKQVGINIDEASYKTIGFAGILEQLEAKTRGQADAYRTTSKGLSDYMKTMWGEVKEQIGSVLNEITKPRQEIFGSIFADLATKFEEWRSKADFTTWANNAKRSAVEFGAVALEVFAKVIEEGGKLPAMLAATTQGLATMGQFVVAMGRAAVSVFDEIAKAVQVPYTLATGKVWAVDPRVYEEIDKLGVAMASVRLSAEDIGPKLAGWAPVAKKTADEIRGMAQGVRDLQKMSDFIGEDIYGSNYDWVKEMGKVPPEVKKSQDQLTYFFDGEERVVGQTELITNAFTALKESIKESSAELATMTDKAAAFRAAVAAQQSTIYTNVQERWGGLIRRQGGGSIPGYGGGDKVPAMLEPGEFVLRKEAVRSLGVDMLNTLNRNADAGGQKGYIVVDFRLGGNSYPITAKKEEVLDVFLKALQHADLTQG